jgi:hypothetical protein
MSLKRTTAGKLLLLSSGGLRVCTCCDNSGTTYRRIFDCCAQCKFVWVPSAYLDLLGGEWVGTLLINGKCYSDPDSILRTRPQIEAEFPGTLIFDDGISNSPLNCPDARTSGFCPACQQCCIAAYVSRGCFVGAPASLPPSRTSVCCNWGRQATISYTRTRISQRNVIYDYFNGTTTLCGCNFPPGSGVETYDDFTEAGACRIRRNGSGNSCANGCTYTTLFAYCQGVGCNHNGNYPGGGCQGTSTNCNRNVIPSIGECSPSLGCNRFEQVRTPGADCFRECPPNPQGPDPFAPDCDEYKSDFSSQCSRNCFSGLTQVQHEQRYFFTDYCYNSFCELCGGCRRCPCAEQYQCQMYETQAIYDVLEWSVTVEDTELCDSDPCTEYNGGSNCPPQIQEPPDQCNMIGGCEDPNVGGGMAAPDSAWSMI